MGELNEMVCLICRTEFRSDNVCDTVKMVTLGVKGIETLCQFSVLRGDEQLTEYLLKFNS